MPIAARCRSARDLQTSTSTSTSSTSRTCAGIRRRCLRAAAAAAAAARSRAASAASASATRAARAPTPTTRAMSERQDEPGARVPPLASPQEWDEYHSRWEGIWRDGCAPGQFFDKASSSPSLLSLLSLPLTPAQEQHLQATGGLPPGHPSPPAVDARGKRALVPGCGRGYDVQAFARAGAAEAVGLELSAAAAEAARAYLEGALGKEEGARARVQEGDFFDAAALPAASFDLGYDLTFLCALHPDMRQAWADGWARVLRPGARLVTACYPIDASRGQSAGPPWPLTPALYERLLLGGLFRKVWLAPVPPGMSHPDRAGHEWLGIWERL